jgi:ankyrin repeat protein
METYYGIVSIVTERGYGTFYDSGVLLYYMRDGNKMTIINNKICDNKYANYELLGEGRSHYKYCNGKDILNIFIDCESNIFIGEFTWFNKSYLFNVYQDRVRNFISCANCKIIYKAITHGIDLDSEDKFGNTILYYAINNNDIKNVKLLLEHNVNIFCINEFKKSAYHCSLSKKEDTDSNALEIYSILSNITLKNFYLFIWCSNNSIKFPINILQKILKYYLY